MNTKPCDPPRIDAFLQGNLSPTQEAEFTQHLDQCEICRTTLEDRAADQLSWEEAKSMLASPPCNRMPLPKEEAESKSLPLPVRQIIDVLAPTDEPTSLGRIDSFEILAVIGCGAMGVVLKACDRSLNRIVALKIMHPSLAVCGTARQRFAREAQAAAGVLHRNVVAIHSVSAGCSLPYLVMPYLKGGSLQQRVDRDGPLSLPEILRVGSQIAAGLAAAHEQGLIHRDIKPANVMLDDGVETVVITDFGLARAIDDATMTRSGAITGTPEFMSPEQARGELVDFSSDLFSLGSVLYVLCTGRAPFRAETAFGVLRRITDDHPKPIRDLNSEVPLWLCGIIKELQSKRPETRPSAEATHTLLQRCLAHVHQPDQIKLPDELEATPSFLATVLSRPFQIGVLTMTLFSLLLVLTYAMLPTSVQDAATEKMGVTTTTAKSEATSNIGDEPTVFKKIDVQFPSPDQTGTLIVDITRGFVDVVGHDEPNVIIEVLNPKPQANSKDSDKGIKQQFAPHFDFDIDKRTNQIKLDTYNNTYIMNLRVKVPFRTNLSLDTYRDGYLQVKNITGTIHTHSQNSDIRLLDISGTATAFSYNGDITVTFKDVDEKAKLDFESQNGSIDLSLPENIKATTGISAGRGTYGTAFDIKMMTTIPGSIAEELAKLDNPDEYRLGTINGGGIPIRIETEKGTVTLRKNSNAVSQTSGKKFVTAFANSNEIGTLNVDIKRGAITVVGHDAPEVIVELEVPNYTPAAKDQGGLTELRPNNLDFDITTTGNKIKVDSNSQRYITNLQIKLPRNTNLVLDSYRDGELQVTQVHGHLDVRSFHSHITLTDCSGSADLYSYHGNLVASFDSINPDKPLEFESYNGSIDLSLPADIQVNTQLRTGHGKLLTDFEITEVGDPVQSEIRNDGTSKIEFDKFVRGTINGGGSMLKAESENDDIRIRRRMTGLGERLGQEWDEKLGEKLGKEWNERLNGEGKADK